jgi:arylsulfatase A
MLPELTKSAVKFIDSRKGNKQPFFMYIPWNAPHSPVVPSKEWQGKSGINAHADFVMQTDDSYGQVINALKENGMWDNTIVFYSADNGTSPYTSGQKKLVAIGHKSSAQFKGFKSDIYDGGHRVPFMVTWPKHIKKGTESTDLVCLTDIYSTVAEIVNYDLSEKDGVDSLSFLAVIKGNEGTPRTDVIHHSISGFFAIRKGNWKLCVSNGSGGWGQPKENFEKSQNPQELSDSYQLFDMSVDESEKINLANKNPEIVAEMLDLLEKQVREGRSTVGVVQSNDENVNILIHKGLVKKD